MDNNIFALIDHYRQRLANHSFCSRLRGCSSHDKSIFFFVPQMSFFVLGFRDLLEYMRTPFPRTPAELMLNEHCSEDGDHWLWFLQDLETLQLSMHAWGGKTQADTLELLWSPHNAAVRRQVYDLMVMVSQCKNAEEKLVIVECLEAAFAVFIESLNVYTKRIGVYKKLVYFGEQHYEKESEHTMGSWLENEEARKQKSSQAVGAIRYPVMAQMVEDIFSGFDAMFSCWEKHMGKPVRKLALLQFNTMTSASSEIGSDNRIRQFK